MTRDDLLKRTTRQPLPGQMVKKHIALQQKHLDFLLDFCYQAKKTTGVHLSHSTIIQYLLERLSEKELDRRTLEEKEDLKILILESEK